MRVRMRVEVSGTRNGEKWPPRGTVVELDDNEGAQLCAAGLAEPVTEDVVETAVPSTEDVETREGDIPAPDPGPDSAPDSAPDPAAVREWAAANGIRVSAKGKVPVDVVEAYLAAQA